MRIKLNGEFREIRDSLNVKKLLDELNLPTDGVAVAINEEVVPRANYAGRDFREDDVVEIIHAVGGGSMNQPG